MQKFGLFATLVAVCMSFARIAFAQEAYVIGVTATMTGPAAGIYAPVIDAMKAYLEHVNRKGGINGKPVRIIVLDNQNDPARATADARRLLTQDQAIMVINASLSSTYAPVAAEARRANVPLYYAGAVCPKDTYPPADPLQFCSTAFGANLDSQAALGFIKSNSTGAVRLGLAAMGIPIARTEIDYAEFLSRQMGMTPVEKQITPPPATDFAPFAAKLRDGNPNWVWSWSPWDAQIKTFEALRKLGWNGRYITWGHLNAEEELARIKDPTLHIVGANALFQDDLPIHAEIRAVIHQAKLNYPNSYLTEGFIAGLVVETALKNTPWPPRPARVLAAMNNLKVDLKGLRGGPLEWTRDNHFRTKQYYRVWRWDNARQSIVRVQDWQAIEVKR